MQKSVYYQAFKIFQLQTRWLIRNLIFHLELFQHLCSLIIFIICVDKTKEKIKLSTEYPTITCDSWWDKFKHRSYFCMTLHFVDSNLQLHKHSLKTVPFNEAHTGEAIKGLLSKILAEFGINPSNIIIVSAFTIQKFRNSFVFDLLGYLIKVLTCQRAVNC